MLLDGIEIKIIKKRIKNIYIRIKPPHGEVVISAPVNMSDEDIMAFARSRLEWIRSHRSRYDGAEQLQLLTGDKVYLWGRAYSLVVIEGRGSADLSGQSIILSVPAGASFEQRRAVIDSFYREQLLQKISEYAPALEERTGLHAQEWRVKAMKTRWGSCNTVRKRIWLSLMLAQKPLCCLEYVIVHELCHLLVPNHGPDFKLFMDSFYPDWRSTKKLLNGGHNV